MEDLLVIKDLKKKYDNHIIFQNMNFNVQGGDKVAIIGKSGSGKSTLLNILGLLENPSSGIYRHDGQDNININSSKARKILRKKIGYLFQNYGLLENETVEKNLLLAMRYGKYENKKQAIQEALALVGLEHLGKRKVFTLSGGEQQRVALARLLVKPCEIILADEPTGNLDEGSTHIILDLLMKLNDEGKTIILVTHDRGLLSRFNKIINLDDYCMNSK